MTDRSSCAVFVASQSVSEDLSLPSVQLQDSRQLGLKSYRQS